MEANEKKIKTKNPRILIILATAAVLGGALITYMMLNPSLSTENAKVMRTKTTVSAKMLGQISKIYVKEGDFVPKGGPLFELHSAELNAQKAQAEANLVVAQESIRLSKVAFNRSKSDFDRAKNQYNNQIISTETYDHAEKSFEAAQIDFTLAQKKIDIAQAQLDLISATLDNTKISAPFDAVVNKKWMSEGEILQPGQPVLSLYEQRSAWVEANFEETKIGLLKIGQKAEIRVDAYPGVVFKGRVGEIGFSTGNENSLIPQNNAAGNFTKVTQRIPVKILIDDSTDLQDPKVKRLIPGSSAVVDVKP